MKKNEPKQLKQKEAQNKMKAKNAYIFDIELWIANPNSENVLVSNIFFFS